MSSCFIYETTGHFAEVWTDRRQMVVADTLRASEALAMRRSIMISEALTVSETIDGRATTWVFDTLRVADAIQTKASPKVSVREVGRLSERVFDRRSLNIADTATFADTFIPRWSLSISDAGRFAEAFTPVAHPATRVADKGKLAEAWRPIRSANVADALTVHDGISYRRSLTVSEAITASDVLTLRASPRVTVSDVGLFADIIAPKRFPRASVVDELFVEDYWRIPAPAGAIVTTAWTANTDTFGMSRYSGRPFDSVQEIDGVMFASGPDGLYRLGADTGAGMPIDAWVLTGKSDFGSEAVKRQHVLYAGATVNGRLQTTVFDAAYGAVSPGYTYQFEQRSGDDFGPQRAKLGRGLRSRYWQFKVGNVNGASFALDTLSLLPDIGSRRV